MGKLNCKCIIIAYYHDMYLAVSRTGIRMEPYCKFVWQEYGCCNWALHSTQAQVRAHFSQLIFEDEGRPRGTSKELLILNQL